MISREMIVAETRGWIGTPYRHQASLKGIGCDCLGLVRGVWRVVIGDEPERAPPYAPDWAEAAGGEPLADAAARHLIAIERDAFCDGDVLLFRWRANLPAKHAAILVASDRMVHAQQCAAVAMATLSPWWRRRIAFAAVFEERKKARDCRHHADASRPLRSPRCRRERQPQADPPIPLWNHGEHFCQTRS